ncbi:phosphopantetheine-binding protein [Actinacidiphila bryophytorum]|uniref:phosphopantetheine-binding protein n=1 Tax=Actinacidiphila bryophytorum TaxID=1436133 RepID=UPI0021769733|nr:phosphopantetheine-binding protein [Actinacidiphila bryophytorum]UWE08646.1 phosphopantetheine-binding protein [Actinacidiphila bryophytorum]
MTNEAAPLREERARSGVLAVLGDILQLPDGIEDDTDLSACGLTSLEALTLIFAIEEEFRMSVPDEELKLANFLTVGRIVRIVLSHTGDAGRQG